MPSNQTYFAPDYQNLYEPIESVPSPSYATIQNWIGHSIQESPTTEIKGLVVYYIASCGRPPQTEKLHIKELIKQNKDLVETYAAEGFAVLWLPNRSGLASHSIIWPFEYAKEKLIQITTRNSDIDYDKLKSSFCKNNYDLVVKLSAQGFKIISGSAMTFHYDPITITVR